MPLHHLLLAVLVTVVWGTNFALVKVVLETWPPLFFVFARFLICLLPAVFFLKRPDVSWGNLAAYGIFIGVGQFGLGFLAMDGYISPGLTSLVLQTQAFFTIFFAMYFESERLRNFQWVALAIASAGIGVIAYNAWGVVGNSDGSVAGVINPTTVLGLCLAIAAAIFWGMGNSVAKRAGRINMLAYVVWASMFSLPPLLILSLIYEGPEKIILALSSTNIGMWGAIAWQSIGNTMFGFAVWGWLLARYPTAAVSPISLLVPVFGLGTSAFFLDEPLQPWKLSAVGLILFGIGLNTIWPRILNRRAAPKKPHHL
ncbi:MAG TPA: EamA family transporter [Rhodospirillaceae bacterium]|nr:EamA family transporter [Candidatus Neomarinimicrobiota bacterium]HCX14736.1 EamA family transporter [Rhodospirillaceae bacterium]